MVCRLLGRVLTTAVVLAMAAVLWVPSAATAAATPTVAAP